MNSTEIIDALREIGYKTWHAKQRLILGGSKLIERTDFNLGQNTKEHALRLILKTRQIDIWLIVQMFLLSPVLFSLLHAYVMHTDKLTMYRNYC